VQAAGDGAAALAALAASGFDLLLTDMILPDMTGTTLAERARRQDPGLKPIFMSGHPESAVRAGGAGEDAHFLAKPFTSLELAQAVRQVLDAGP
jgi:CheY-like chemotaxis protein